MIKRYELTLLDNGQIDESESDNGDYCMYEDHAKAVAAKEREIDMLKLDLLNESRRIERYESDRLRNQRIGAKLVEQRNRWITKAVGDIKLGEAVRIEDEELAQAAKPS